MFLVYFLVVLGVGGCRKYTGASILTKFDKHLENNQKSS